MGFNDNLKLLLKDRNLKQADLCRMTGIQTSLMSDYLGGKKSPTIGNAILVADALNISLDTLVGKETDPIEPQNSNDLSPIQRKVISDIEQMDESDLVAVKAFINSLGEYKKSFGMKK